MTRKKETHAPVSQEDTAQVQHLLGQFHKIAGKLHASSSQTEAEAALADITTLSEAAQLALLKALSKEHDTDAADVLLAINELSQSRAARKEARRSLIRLEEVRIYPKWSPPIDRPQLVQISTNPPRFWKGILTDTFESGEIQLLLCWEQGEDYSQARILGFLLEFWHDGVKDFFTEVASKRHIETHIEEMRASARIKTRECTLAEGRRLIQDALGVNKRYGTVPHGDYRHNLMLVKQLVLDATDLGEEEGLSSFGENMTPQEVVTNFVESLTSGNFNFAYDLLSSNSSIRDGLSRAEWIKRREAWVEEADPSNFQPEFIHELEKKQGGLWLPGRLREASSSTRKEFDTGWSIEMDNTPLSEGIKELPSATAVNPVTQRHWFWSRYTLVMEQDKWRIEGMTDEGANAQNLTSAELQKRISEQLKQVDQITKKHKPTDPDAEHYMEEILWHLGQAISYSDALIVKSPQDRRAYENAAADLIALKEFERAVVYFEPLVQRFPEKKNEELLQLAGIQIQLSASLLEEEEDEAVEEYRELAEANIRESLALDNNYLGHLLLAELLKDDHERLDEAEDHLNQAKASNTNEDIEFAIEHNLGEIAMNQEQYDKALQHFQRVAEYDPTDAEAWYEMAEAHNLLENIEEAETNYKRAIELQPDSIDYYSALSRMYMEHAQPSKSREVLEEGLRANPDSAELRAYLALVVSESGDYRAAEALLDEAESIDPDLEIIEMFRLLLNVNKTRRLPTVNRTKELPDANRTKQSPGIKKAKSRARRK